MRVAQFVVVLITVSCGPARDTSSTAEPSRASRVLFETGISPGEGIPVVDAASDYVPLRSAPSYDAAAIDTVVLHGSRRLTYDSTRFQTLRSVPVRVVASSRIGGRVLGRLGEGHGHDRLLVSSRWGGRTGVVRRTSLSLPLDSAIRPCPVACRG